MARLPLAPRLGAFGIRGAEFDADGERKGPLLRHCRRLAALTLAEQVALEARWIPTSKNFADGPSRGRGPAPCGNDLDGLYEGLRLPRRERQALGRFMAEMQRRQLVADFEKSLSKGVVSGPEIPFAFQDLF